MDGKICLVTGATSGIGYFTAREIASMGASVVIVGRDLSRCLAAVQRIKDESGNNAVEYLLADLSSQAQVRLIAAQFCAQHDHLDVLINNAGAPFLFRQDSVDGIEMTFALNHLAYFLLTLLLIKSLIAAPNARVINVSSGSHVNEHIDFNDLQLKKFYNPIHAYGRSKLANILFTYELSRRLVNTHVTTNALTPGMVATDIWKKVNRFLTPFLYPLIHHYGQTPLEGAQTSIYLATSPEVEGITGKYYAFKHQVRSDPITHDIGLARRLWQVSMELVGLEDEGELF